MPTRRLAVALLLLVASGCGSNPLNVQPWPEGPEYGRIVVAGDYRIYTTSDDDEFLKELVGDLQRTRTLYDKLVVVDATIEGPLPQRPGYVFAYRNEWVEHTKQVTGTDAPIYLKIDRGGYFLGDAFATFVHGEPQTRSVVRHEGLHQHFGRFEQRVPPFIEEGVATLFEAGFEDGNLDRPRMNATRARRLGEAARRKRLWPLETLLTMHAGDVIGRDHRSIDTFYAQAWALAHFLVGTREYRPGFQRMLAAFATGEAGGRSTPAIFEASFGKPFAEIEQDYRDYVRELTGFSDDLQGADSVSQ